MMNYGGGNSDDAASTSAAAKSNSDAAAAAAAASRWETMLVGNYFGGGDFFHNFPPDSSSPPAMSTVAVTQQHHDPSAAPQIQGYATACHLAAAAASGNTYPLRNGNNNINGGMTNNNSTANLLYGYHPPTPPPPHSLPNGSPYAMFMSGSGNNNGGGGSGSGGSHQQQHYLPGGGSEELYHHNPQFDLRLPVTAVQQQQQQKQQNNRRRRRPQEGGASTSHSYTTDQYSTNNYDFGNYYNTIENNAALAAAAATAAAASAAMASSPNRMVDRIVTDDGNGRSFSNNTQNSGQQQQQQHCKNSNYGSHSVSISATAGAGASPDDINLNELEYCDSLSRGLDDPNNFSWLENVFTTMNGHNNGGGGSSSSSSVANSTTAMTNDLHITMTNNRDAYRNNNSFKTEGGRAGISEMLQLFQEQNGIMGGATDQRHMSTNSFGGSKHGSKMMMMPQPPQGQHQYSTERSWGDQGNRGGGHSTTLDAYLVAQLHQQHSQHHHHHHKAIEVQQHQIQQHRHHKETKSPYTSHSATEVGSSRGKLPRSATSSTAATATTSSSRLSPNRTDHSSLPSAQIDPLLERISLTVTAVSLTPMSGNEVVRHIRDKADDVITRFLPCVDFLVNCQQELRQGLALAQQQQQRGRRGSAQSRNNAVMTPRQFHASYVAPLPNRFKRQYEPLMAHEHLHHALRSLESLVRDSAAAVPQGNDHVKNAFLGGMRENQSWGLRKWLSEHGGAGSICNDVEEVMRHVKALKREEETTKRLAEILRPIARQAHDRLKKDVPAAYQEKSSAHPYLPFFHRLESCLKQMATYDPEEDDVICLEDSDDEDEDVTVLSDKAAVTSQDPIAAMSRSSGSNLPAAMKEDLAFNSKWAECFLEGKVGNDAKRSRLDSDGKASAADPLIGEKHEGADVAETSKAKEPEVICLIDSDDEVDENDSFGLEFGRLERLSPPQLAKNNNPDAPLHGLTSQYGTSTKASIAKEGDQWRCVQCTFLNEAFSKQCAMCNDDDSADGGNSSDDLANFLGASSFLLESEQRNQSFNGSDQLLQLNCFTPTNHLITGAEQQQWRALQSADARELECLAEHISGGGSLPKQAHLHTDKFWAKTDTFPQILLLFRSILQHPSSYRFLEPVDETQLFMMGSPEYTSIVKHPLCFHEIVSALSKSEDAVIHPYLTMRLSNGKLAVANNEELEHWNMWNGLHLIEAIDLVLLNSLAYNGNLANSEQLQIETESLRDLLWEGVNSMLKQLQPHRRRDHLPQRRSVDSGFVVVKVCRR